MAYADFHTEGGARIHLEQRSDDLGFADVAVARDESLRSSVPFDEAIESALTPIADAFLRSAARLTARPETLSVEFGIRLHYRDGVVIATQPEDSHFKVTITWHTSDRRAELGY